jgi:hypothetical protein
MGRSASILIEGGFDVVIFDMITLLLRFIYESSKHPFLVRLQCRDGYAPLWYETSVHQPYNGECLNVLLNFGIHRWTTVGRFRWITRVSHARMFVIQFQNVQGLVIFNDLPSHCRHMTNLVCDVPVHLIHRLQVLSLTWLTVMLCPTFHHKRGSTFDGGIFHHLQSKVSSCKYQLVTLKSLTFWHH